MFILNFVPNLNSFFSNREKSKIALGIKDWLDSLEHSQLDHFPPNVDFLDTTIVHEIERCVDSHVVSLFVYSFLHNLNKNFSYNSLMKLSFKPTLHLENSSFPSLFFVEMLFQIQEQSFVFMIVLLISRKTVMYHSEKRERLSVSIIRWISRNILPVNWLQTI